MRSRHQEVVKLKAQINELESKKTMKSINETKTRIFQKINNIDKPLAKQLKRERDNIHINKIKNEKRAITTDTEKIQRIIMSYFKKLYARKLEN
jgi:seryl-tRNA synthetase